MRWVRLWRYLWALPTTSIGLIFVAVALATGGEAKTVAGVLEVHGGGITWLLRHCRLGVRGASAITLGHVVLGLDRDALEWTRAHERVHVKQCERWGPFFLPAYIAASLWALMRGGDVYRDNAFEKEAYGEGKGF